MVDKIIFLDIDGPMIPGTRYLENKMCSFEQDFCPRCVMVLKKILEDSQAKLVFNTSHNTALFTSSEHPGLLNVANQHGLTPYLHEKATTTYPYITRNELVPEGVDGRRRLIAVKEWLLENQTDNMLWIILDDELIDHKRACRVDFDAGLTLKEYNFAAKYLMFKNFMVF